MSLRDPGNALQPMGGGWVARTVDGLSGYKTLLGALTTLAGAALEYLGYAGAGGMLREAGLLLLGAGGFHKYLKRRLGDKT